MKVCENCQSRILFKRHTSKGHDYCSKECAEYAEHPEFCPKCQSQSIDVSTGNLVSVNFIGRAFIGSSNQCPTCHSVERYLFFFFGIPLIPLGKWKVKSTRPRRFITRKMATAFPDADTHRTYTKEENRRWHLKLFIGFVVFVVIANIIARLLK